MVGHPLEKLQVCYNVCVVMDSEGMYEREIKENLFFFMAVMAALCVHELCT